MDRKRTQSVCRIVIYLLGLLLVCTGISLSTKTGLGISTVTAPSFAISEAFGINISIPIFTLYALMIIAQFIIRGKNYRLRDLLQFPVAIAQSSFVGWFNEQITIHFDLLWQNLLLMVAGVVLTGIGIAMMVDMQIVPNPPDGLTDSISSVTGKDIGLIKNFEDACCVAVAIFIDLVFSGKLISVGVGTVFAMIFLGRTVYVFNRFFKVKVQKLAGLI